jgi:hypothetical protein
MIFTQFSTWINFIQQSEKGLTALVSRFVEKLFLIAFPTFRIAFIAENIFVKKRPMLEYIFGR